MTQIQTKGLLILVFALTNWVLVQEFNLSCHNKEAILFTIDPYYGNLNPKPQRNSYRDPSKRALIDPYYGNLKLSSVTRAQQRCHTSTPRDSIIPELRNIP